MKIPHSEQKCLLHVIPTKDLDNIFKKHSDKSERVNWINYHPNTILKHPRVVDVVLLKLESMKPQNIVIPPKINMDTKNNGLENV